MNLFKVSSNHLSPHAPSSSTTSSFSVIGQVGYRAGLRQHPQFKGAAIIRFLSMQGCRPKAARSSKSFQENKSIFLCKIYLFLNIGQIFHKAHMQVRLAQRLPVYVFCFKFRFNTWRLQDFSIVVSIVWVPGFPGSFPPSFPHFTEFDSALCFSLQF